MTLHARAARRVLRALIWFGPLTITTAACHDLSDSFDDEPLSADGGNQAGNAGVANGAGNGGIAGHAATAGASAGDGAGAGGKTDGGAPSSSGAGGTESRAGYGGADIEPVVPGCTFNDLTPPDGFRSVAVTTRIDISNFRILAIESDGHSIFTKLWSEPPASKNWLCAGQILGPERIATTSLPDGKEEFVSTSDGRVYVFRHFGPVVWSTWLEFRLPERTSFVLDIATATGTDNISYVYINELGRLLVRQKLGPSINDAYGPWTRVADLPGRAIAAGARKDGLQHVLALAEPGIPMISVQTRRAPIVFSKFVEFSDGPLPRLVDLKAGLSNEGDPLAFAADANGELWIRKLSDDTWSAWERFPGPALPGKVTSLAFAHLADAAGTPGMLAILTETRMPYVSTLREGTWGPWVDTR